MKLLSCSLVIMMLQFYRCFGCNSKEDEMLEELYASEIGHILMTIGMAMLPVIELRGAIPFAVSLGFSIPTAFCLSVIGNLIPVPFIVLLIRRIFERARAHPRFRSMIEKLELKAHIKGQTVKKYRFIGLCLLVAVPLPGTGAWTGALVAGVLQMSIRYSFISIFVGVIIAGILVSLATAGVISLF